MLKQRVLTAVVCIPLVVAAIWFGMPWFTILIVICGVCGCLEFYGMVFDKKISFPVLFGTVWSVLYIIRPHFDTPLAIQGLLATTVIIPLIIILFQKQKEGALSHI